MFSRPACLELTHNHGTESDPDFKGYCNGNVDPGRGFGHIGWAGLGGRAQEAGGGGRGRRGRAACVKPPSQSPVTKPTPTPRLAVPDVEAACARFER
jgi:hypothetical protein